MVKMHVYKYKKHKKYIYKSIHIKTFTVITLGNRIIRFSTINKCCFCNKEKVTITRKKISPWTHSASV